MPTTKTTLQSICTKFCKIKHNDDNYSIGGGLDSSKFASRRHEDAKYDEGKLTLGQATQLFKKATGLEIETVKEVLEYAVPNMEWHHAGMLPKAYGGGMKKTYFLNAEEICEVSTNWNSLIEKLALSKTAAIQAAENKRNIEVIKLEFLKANATKLERVSSKPVFFYQTAQEMNGKFGWFDSRYKSYQMPEYFTGWEFNSEKAYHEFFAIQN